MFHDRTQIAAARWGVRRTTTTFILDADRKIVYMGGFDNDPELEKTTGEREHYVRDALDALLAGGSVKEPERLILGCGIYFADPKLDAYVRGNN